MPRRPQTRPTAARPGRPAAVPGPEDFISRFLRLTRPDSLRLIALIILVGLGWIGFLPKAEIRGMAEIVDGDSLTISGDRIRLYAIDVPELHQPCIHGGACGARARDHLAKLIAGRKLICQTFDTDRYGRNVSQCFVDEAPAAGKPVKGEDIGRSMVRDGQAMAYGKIAKLYLPDQPAQFDFEPPWDWRESHPPR